MITRRYLFEADDDNTTSTGGNTTAAKTDMKDFSDDDFTIGDADNAGNAKKEDTEEKKEDEPKEDTNDQGTNEDQTDDENQEDDTDMGDEEGGDENQEEPTEDNMYGDSDETNKTDPNSLKSKDREIFDNLTIEEQQIKIRELKILFSDLHTNISTLIDKLNQISVDADELSPQVRRTITILSGMKKDVSFYILNLYDQKSYMENDTMFNYLLLKLNNIQDVIKNIKNELIDDN